MGKEIKKKSFVFNIEWQEILLSYPSEVRLEVYDAIIEYVASGTLLELKPMAKMAFSFIKKEIDYNEQKYQDVVNKRSEAGKRGMESRYNKGVTNDNKSNKSYQDITNITDNVNVNVNENDKEKEKLEKENPISSDKPKAKQYDLSFVAEEFVEVFAEWLEYKRARRESYNTPMGLKKCYSHLLNLSGNDVGKAKLIVEQSIANNYAGLFELKGDFAKQAQQRVRANLGVGEFINQQGKRTYGTGKYIIPDDAPPRPSDRHYWSQTTEQWLL